MCQPPESRGANAPRSLRGRYGVKVGRNNQAFKYAIHSRNRDGHFEFEREVNAENLTLCGYFLRADQIRGISPIASAINRFKDANEAIEYALAKAKLANKVGLITKREFDPNIDDEESFEQDNTAVKNRVKGNYSPACSVFGNFGSSFVE